MPYADSPTIILGADGFLGRNLLDRWQAEGWPCHAVGRAAGDFTDPAVVDRAFRDAPKAGRIFHVITKQRTGNIQWGIQGELLRDNASIHLNILEAWRHHQPQAKLVSLGSSCTYAEASHPTPEEEFGIGRPHPSVQGYALAKQLLATGCETYGKQYGLHWLHCVLATVYGPHAHTEDTRAHFMAAMIDRAVRTKRSGAMEFEVWGNPHTVRDLLHAHDQIDAVLLADAHFEDRIINVTPNAPVEVGDCATAILRALRWDARIVSPPGSFQGAGYKSLDSARFLAATGWKPKLSVEAGVAQVLAADYGEAIAP
ncbi:NAD-dependent epimerase/dehydratase family protein [Falsiroseomonas stagni]|uniref:Nucleoside-diphosphate-sugar epimerase n=1 Tax=Falsiroseomonas stagni DSM 19981 TaxID=1123062 RepID=A0A1I3XJK0_9PROT|nr:NAD-dependent epimerase/dehydratase family protein [Falsiroseomonas stagni]SFK19764.1 Nucleoside-diphosphate-sugar epimerase [Falsiroseomonas stagni DSM 19981]